ncbi:bacterial transcriptional activator domain-containing protein [Actinomadura barringtoniae]|uniref:Bacterial transcriptional activator domain-containing protein n=1 Tax=Actinomadura barringtoniae TaxID=1427535 RepID=A0A939PQB6_9ACTN|nr:bacterial transcriptional activator domain-containing protein [Actinomadura barringtoniae]MBO2454199.1 bacterial transcriptional activator domain-containing protein [Actinomadura barringtoniae]
MELDLSQAGGLRVVGAGGEQFQRVVIADLLSEAIRGRRRVVTTRAALTAVFGAGLGEQIADAGVGNLHLAATANGVLDFIGGEVVGQVGRCQDTKLDATGEAPGPPAETPLVGVLDAAVEPARAVYELQRGAEFGVGAVVLGDWPHGTTLAIDGSGLISDAIGQGAHGLTGTQVTLLDEGRARQVLQAAGIATSTLATPPDGMTTAMPPRAVVTDLQAPPGLVRLIGRVAVEGPGGQFGVHKSPDMQALLALLARNRTTLLTENTIVEMLWDGAAPSPNRFKTVLKTTRTKLCGALGVPHNQGITVIGNTGGNGYSLVQKAFTCDVWQLRDLLALAAASSDQKAAALNAAVDLYTGPYLPNVPHDWARSDARDLNRDIVQALTQLADMATTPDETLLHLDRAAGLDPAAEHLCRQRMSILADLGRITAVHNTYERLTETLRDRRRLPDRRTADLYRRLTSNS